MDDTRPAVLRDLVKAAADDRSGEIAAPALVSRERLLQDLQSIRQKPIVAGDVHLIIINFVDSKAYDNIIQIFGYKQADNIQTIRLENLKVLTRKMTVYQIGVWSIGLIYAAGKNEAPEEFFDALVSHLAKPIICRGIPMPIKAGVGVYDLAMGLGSTEDLLQSTYIASQASSRMASAWVTCDYHYAENHQRAFALIADVSYSLASTNEFELCYQPRFSLKTGKCIAAEALLRWRHPSYGSVTPNEFIPLVEMTGLIREMTEWVLTRAIAKTVQWHKHGYHLKVSVNISVCNLQEVDFVERVRKLLAHFGLRPEYLELEISESQSFVDWDIAHSQLESLRAMGVGVAVDDFGTGSNSFSYLQTVPVSAVKIHQSLVQTMKGNPKNQAVVKSIIGLAHALGVECVAEGVETQEANMLLESLDCDYAQGYYLGRPMYTVDFDEWSSRNIITA